MADKPDGIEKSIASALLYLADYIRAKSNGKFLSMRCLCASKHLILFIENGSAKDTSAGEKKKMKILLPFFIRPYANERPVHRYEKRC